MKYIIQSEQSWSCSSAVIHKHYYTNIYLMMAILLLDGWKSIWISFHRLTTAAVAVAAYRVAIVIIVHEHQMVAASLPVNWFIDFDEYFCRLNDALLLALFDECVNRVDISRQKFLWHFCNVVMSGVIIISMKYILFSLSKVIFKCIRFPFLACWH